MKTAIFRAFCGVVALFSLACGEKIAGLENDPTPLLTIKVQTKGDIKKLLPPGTKFEELNLRAALVWGGLPSQPRFCTENALGMGKDPKAALVYAKGCKDIFGFVPKLVQATGKVQPDGSASIDVHHLPTAEVMVGLPDGRVAHGNIVIFDDRNHNGTLDLREGNHHFVCRESRGGPNGNGPSNCPPEFEGGQGEGKGGETAATGADGGAIPQDTGNTGGGQTGNNGGPGNNDDEPWIPDFVYGASFKSMILPHTRVTYREGTYSLGSFFYPTIGCDAPPKGFSLRAVSGLPTESTCETKAIEEQVVEVALEATETVSEMACTPWNFHFHDSRRKPDLTQPYVCIDGNALIAASPPDDMCKALSAVSLRGCRAKHDCEEADWDDHKDPPDWWPCGTYIDPLEKKKAEKEAEEKAKNGGGSGS